MLLSDSVVADAPLLPSGRRMSGRAAAVKLVFVIDNMRLGGTELNAVRTAERLNKANFDLHVVCLGEDGPLTARYHAMGVPVTKLRLRSFYGLSMLTSGWRFARLLRRERVKIVHAHDVYSNVFATFWARIARTPVVVTSRRWWHSLPNGKLQLGNRLAFARSDAILANSSQVARSVEEEARIASSKIWTVPNFADDEAFGPPSEQDRARIRLGWNVPPGSVAIGCVARFDPVKDHATLLEAFALVHAECPDAYLVLIGDGETRLALEAHVSALGIEDSVHFAGELYGGSNYHRGLDISVLTSRSEGFPNSLVEAMAAGNPVVATAVGGSVDAVADGETGLLVPPGDARRAAGALLALVADPELRKRLGDAGQRVAQQKYTASSAVDRLETMYSRLLDGRAR
jgi:glycosyltransferase involved in cell wall biosynthesis